MFVTKQLNQEQVLDSLARVVVAEDSEEVMQVLPGIPDIQANDECFACGAWGYGLSNWFFRLLLKTQNLQLDVTLPCWRVLADADTRAREAQNMTAVCRFVLVLLGKENFPSEGGRFVLTGTEGGDCTWGLYSPVGEEVCTGEGWARAIDLVAGSDTPCLGGDLIKILP